MKVAAIQMVSGRQVQANLARARELMTRAAGMGAELVVLPEYFCLLAQHDTDKLAICERVGEGPIQAMLAQTARELGLWVVGGSLPLVQGAPGTTGRHVYNSTLVYSPQGDRVARYDKMHLFRFDNGREQYDEARVLSAGDAPVGFELASRDGHVWRIGLSICYDLRFPELYRAHARQGAELLLVPSAFTHTTGQAHWEVLLRARAIENLAYVVAAAQGGAHESGRNTWGQSMVLDPWGRVLAEEAQGEAVVLAELEAEKLQEIRRQLPALEHRVL